MFTWLKLHSESCSFSLLMWGDPKGLTFKQVKLQRWIALVKICFTTTMLIPLLKYVSYSVINVYLYRHREESYQKISTQ